MRPRDLPLSRADVAQDARREPGHDTRQRVRTALYTAVAGILAVGAGAGIGALLRDQDETLALAAQLLTTSVCALALGYLSEPVLLKLFPAHPGPADARPSR